MNFVKKLITPRYLVTEDQIKGDLPTTGEVFRKTFDIAWPSAVESVLVALISAMDMIMVGSLGKEAISAVGICTQPKFICLAPVFAINTAAVVLVSRRKGQERREDAIDYSKIAILFSLLISCIFCVLMFIYAKPLLYFAGANDDYINMAVTYYRIVIASMIPYCTGLTMTACHRGSGKTRISMVTNLTANIVNVIFNYILIYGHFGFPRLEVTGAAIATAIGNLVAFFIAAVSVFMKKSYIVLNFKKIDEFLDKCTSFITVMRNAFVEQIILRVGFFLYAKVVANLGTTEFAAHQATMSIMNITFSLGDGLQIATTSLVGQSLGAKREDMAIIHTKVSRIIGIAIGLVMLVVINVFKRQFLGVFTSDESVIQMAFIPMTILSVVCVFQIPQVIMFGTLRAAGDLRFVSATQLFCIGFLRTFVSYILTYPVGLGLLGAWLGLFMDQMCRFTLSSLRIKSLKWLHFKV